MWDGGGIMNTCYNVMYIYTCTYVCVNLLDHRIYFTEIGQDIYTMAEDGPSHFPPEVVAALKPEARHDFATRSVKVLLVFFVFFACAACSCLHHQMIPGERSFVDDRLQRSEQEIRTSLHDAGVEAKLPLGTQYRSNFRVKIITLHEEST